MHIPTVANDDELKKDLNYYQYHVAIGDGNMLEMKWFKDHPKKLYSVKDIVDYIYSVNPFIENSINNDDLEYSPLDSLKKQIRRVMKKEFGDYLAKTEKSYKYEADQAHVMYLVNVLLKDYLNNLVLPDVENKMLLESTARFCQVAYGDKWEEKLLEWIKQAEENKQN